MRHGTTSIGDALREFMNKSRMKPRLMEVRIQDNWEQLMGKTIARYTQSIQLIDNKLIVTTTVAPLKQELTYSKDKIIKLVNEMLGENIVKEVMIR
jgi:predicted nucleic acid-binding Zn ribbon protein